MTKTLHSPEANRLRQLLVEARERSGLTQAQVATELRRPQSFVSKYENGERRLDVTEFLAVCAILEAKAEVIIATLQTTPARRRAPAQPRRRQV